MTASEAGLDLGRSAYAEQRWSEAFRHFGEADRDGGIPAADLERLATVAMLMGQSATGIDTLTRAHEEFLVLGDVSGAARCAGWLGMYLMNWGETARSTGWFARAQRLVRELAEPSAVEGFLLLPLALGALESGDTEIAARNFDQVEAFAQRFQDPDLLAMGRLGQAMTRIMQGYTGEAMALLDEVMVAVTAGELSVVTSGIIYCEVIGSCQSVFDLRRALDWTAALDRWCNGRPEMLLFSGQCQVYRAELYVLHGAWTEAFEAAALAQDRAAHSDPQALYGGCYQQGEVQRLRGELDAAEESYRQAGKSGYEPQPGLALLRLARGDIEYAQTLIRRAVDTSDQVTRRHLLPGLVEIELAAGDIGAARTGAQELTAWARECAMPMAQAIAGQADGAVLLAENNPSGALSALRRAWRLWSGLDVPFEAARCRVLVGRACRTLGDEGSALMDFEAARNDLRDLGAVPALGALDSLLRQNDGERAGPLTSREVEVLRLVSAGKTNRVVAAELYLSEKTVARHLSNMFLKLGLSSRAAATSYAYEHGLIE